MKQENIYRLLIATLIMTSGAFGMLWNSEKKELESKKDSMTEVLYNDIEQIGTQLLISAEVLGEYEEGFTEKEQILFEQSLRSDGKVISQLGENSQHIIEQLEVENRAIQEVDEKYFSTIEQSILLTADGKVTDQAKIGELQAILREYGNRLTQFFDQSEQKEIIQNPDNQEQFIKILTDLESELVAW
ncbi:hypothetical protein [Thalassobacillus sp. CUG 92003]|uniref:hypothetical protein n=1 Tax=Thalassobacillus sp. CUG 92003 TaxID=2736641 RepID=UPI0015E7D085|nr:hypothetical protein [Thalassobacillus sp. CUG 92003]